MKRVLVNASGAIVYEGVDAKEKLADGLTYQVHFDLKFRGIDSWNRPVFKDVDSTLHFGSVNKLFNDSTPKEEIISYFKERPEELEYFGDKFGCEPHGGNQSFFKYNFI
jgi:hypothetical protein